MRRLWPYTRGFRRIQSRKLWKVSLVSLALLAAPAWAQSFDLVLAGGRVIDPETGFDQIANVGILEGRIAAVSDAPLSGREHLDASGLVVAPGFIDLHSHALTPLGQRYQMQDGVTTALELEAGAYPMVALDSLFPAGARINYGASAGHFAVRQQVMEGVRRPFIFSRPEPLPGAPGDGVLRGAAATMIADDGQLARINAGLRDGLANGGLGIGLLLDYVDAAVTDAELQAIFAAAASHGAPVFVHLRRGLPGDDSGLREVLEIAEKSGAALHICHLNSSAMMGVGQFLKLIADARARGVDVTSEAYPYNAGSTLISAAVFGRDWQSIFAIDFNDIEWAATGERLTADSFSRYRQEQPQGQVIHHFGREAWTREALLATGVIVASDAMPLLQEEDRVHPRGIGSFARFLSRYSLAPEGGDGLELATALAKVTLYPALRMESFAPVFARKGRLRVGFDADIVVFSPELTDRANYVQPLQPSQGVEHLLVNGVPVIRDGLIEESVFPGRRLLAGPVLQSVELVE